MEPGELPGELAPSAGEGTALAKWELVGGP